MPSSACTAYAVRWNNATDVRTVHNHARGAMVNWLWLQGCQIPNSMEVETIREIFVQIQTAYGVQRKSVPALVVVEIKDLCEESAHTVDLLAAPPKAPASQPPAEAPRAPTASSRPLGRGSRAA